MEPATRRRPSGVYRISAARPRPDDLPSGRSGMPDAMAGESIPELVLDRAALPGFSGSPVYLADGRVVAVLVGNGTGEATGITVARPASICREMLAEGPSQ